MCKTSDLTQWNSAEVKALFITKKYSNHEIPYKLLIWVICEMNEEENSVRRINTPKREEGVYFYIMSKMLLEDDYS